jgi:hypothetical protein
MMSWCPSLSSVICIPGRVIHQGQSMQHTLQDQGVHEIIRFVHMPAGNKGVKCPGFVCVSSLDSRGPQQEVQSGIWSKSRTLSVCRGCACAEGWPMHDYCFAVSLPGVSELHLLCVVVALTWCVHITGTPQFDGLLSMFC